MSDHEFDIETLRKPTHEEIIGLRDAAIELAHDYVDLKHEKTGVSIQFVFEPHELPGQPHPTELRIEERVDATSVIAFCQDQIGAFMSLRIPKEGPASLQDYNPVLTQNIISPELIVSLSGDDSPSSKTAINIFSNLRAIIARISAVRAAGVALHDDYTGPDAEPNPDGTVTITDDGSEAFFAGLPSNQLDGILRSDAEVDAIKSLVHEHLEHDAAALSTGHGLFVHTFKDGSETYISRTKAKLNSNDPEAQRALDAEYSAGVLSNVSIDYDDVDFDYNIEIPFGDVIPQITIVDKRLRKIAIQNAVRNGGAPMETKHTSPDGVVTFGFETTDPEFAAAHAVRMAEFNANAATAGKIESAMKIIELIRNKLEAERVA